MKYKLYEVINANESTVHYILTNSKGTKARWVTYINAHWKPDSNKEILHSNLENIKRHYSSDIHTFLCKGTLKECLMYKDIMQLLN